ncbi:MAG: hypothetical protein ACHQAX_03565 [Gammaproteobacteria bacterium]
MGNGGNNKKLAEDIILNPKKLLDLIKSDFMLAGELMQALTRTQVRALFMKVEIDGLNLTHQLMSLLKEVYDPTKALKLNLDDFKAVEFSNNADIFMSMRKNKTLTMVKSILSEANHEYPIYEDGRESKLVIFKTNFEFPESITDWTRYNFNKSAAIKAYAAEQKRNYVLEQFPLILTGFYQKSNRKIKRDEFPSTTFQGLTLINTVDFLVESKQWALLAEFLLRLDGHSSWRELACDGSPLFKLVTRVNETSLPIDSAESAESQSLRRCLHVIREGVAYYFRRSAAAYSYFMDQLLLLPAQYNAGWVISSVSNYSDFNPIPKLANFRDVGIGAPIITEGQTKKRATFAAQNPTSPENLAKLVKLAGRIDAAMILILANELCVQRIFAHSDLSQPSPTRQFFDRFFSDVFNYTTVMDYAWLVGLDLNADLEKDAGPIHARISQMLDWEMFSAVHFLIESLNDKTALHLIASFDEKAWDSIFEFKTASKALIEKIMIRLMALPPAAFRLFLQKSNPDLHSKLLSYDVKAAQALYSKFHEEYKAEARFESALDCLFTSTEEEIESAIRNNHLRTIEVDACLIERKIDSFIQTPQLFIDLLNTDFVLATRYFERMTDAQIMAMSAVAYEARLGLCETVIKIFAFGAYNGHGDKFKLTLPLKSNQDILKEIGDRLEPNGLMYEYEGYVYDGSWHKPDYMNMITVTVNWYDITKFYKARLHIMREKFMRPIAVQMITKISELCEHQMLTWPADSEQMKNLFFGLIYFGEAKFVFSLIRKSEEGTLLRLFKLFLNASPTLNRENADRFTRWFLAVGNGHPAIHLLIKEIAGLDKERFLIDMDHQARNSIAIGVIDELPSSYASIKRFLDWVMEGERPQLRVQKIVLLLNKATLSALQQRGGGAYGAVLYHLAPDYLEKEHNDFYEVMRRTLVFNPDLGKELLPPPPYSAPMVPSHGADTIIDAQPAQGNSDQLSQMILRMKVLEEQIRNLSNSVNAPAGTFTVNEITMAAYEYIGKLKEENTALTKENARFQELMIDAYKKSIDGSKGEKNIKQRNNF